MVCNYDYKLIKDGKELCSVNKEIIIINSNEDTVVEAIKNEIANFCSVNNLDIDLAYIDASHKNDDLTILMRKNRISGCFEAIVVDEFPDDLMEELCSYYIDNESTMNELSEAVSDLDNSISKLKSACDLNDTLTGIKDTINGGFICTIIVLVVLTLLTFWSTLYMS